MTEFYLRALTQLFYKYIRRAVAFPRTFDCKEVWVIRNKFLSKS